MFKLPESDNRTAVIGSTGSGKTFFSVWLLSTKDFTDRPAVIINSKGDKLLESLGAKPWSLNKFPKEPGLYIINPLPGDDALLSRFFYLCWLHENILVYIDEGYMMPKNDRWFRACLTQGRSKNIEMIICSQRPVFLDKFVWTESSYFVVFNLTNREDRKKVGEYMDGEKPVLLPKHHSLWYDVGEQKSLKLGPVPDKDTLIARFNRREIEVKKAVKL